MWPLSAEPEGSLGHFQVWGPKHLRFSSAEGWGCSVAFLRVPKDCPVAPNSLAEPHLSVNWTPFTAAAIWCSGPSCCMLPNIAAHSGSGSSLKPQVLARLKLQKAERNWDGIQPILAWSLVLYDPLSVTRNDTWVLSQVSYWVWWLQWPSQ